MELPSTKMRHYRLLVVVAVVVVLFAAYFELAPRFKVLSETERKCIGSWSFISPSHASETRIVYHLSRNRRVREEHYYLNSAWPDVPRVTMVGQWDVNNDGKLVIKPNQGVSYARDIISGWLNEFFDDGRQAWQRPVLRRYFDITDVSSNASVIELSRNGNGGSRITMRPFNTDTGTSILR